jgi:hypothetical protein
MFNRKMSAPVSINWRNTSAFSDAGPSVQMILVLRIGQKDSVQARESKTVLPDKKKAARPKRTRHALPSVPRRKSKLQ